MSPATGGCRTGSRRRCGAAATGRTARGTRALVRSGGLAGLLLGCLAAGAGLFSPAADAMPPVQARVERVEPVAVGAYAESPGTVIAAHSAVIAARLTGYIDHVDVDLGDPVKKGQTLLTIDSRDVDARVRQARANIASARASLDEARANYHRYHVLLQKGQVSHQTYQRAQRNYKTTQAQLKAAEAGLKVALAERTYATVRAPMAGVVTARDVDAGDLATPGKTLLRIQESGAAQIMSDVSARAFRTLSVGSAVRVRGPSGKTLDARTVHLGPAASPGTETHPAKFALPVDAHLAPGTFVRVRVPLGKRPALLVPDSVLIHRLGIPAVFVLDHQDRARLRLVRVGPHHGSRVEITAGLHAGDRVILAPGAGISNGTPIQTAQGRANDG